ncbi:hypothetical protein U9M48_001679 [Paspalum notatum var. saurae]|uniref:PNPLA domain-containing protein n=1 Tax=Paspalum notatum var. saurae TaxID=547442 RepID=A0AAQ3PIM9_PASNO
MASGCTAPPPSEGRFITVLSIDGGGISGPIPATVDHLLSGGQAAGGRPRRTHRRLLRRDRRRRRFAGTSTAALITAMLTAPDENKRPLFAAKDIGEFYLENGHNIFPQRKYYCCY